MNSRVSTLFVVASLIASSAVAHQAKGPKGAVIYSSANMRAIHLKSVGVSANDRKFMTSFAIGHMAEARLGALAVKQGGAWSQAFGKTMEKDHNMALQELRDLAKRKGVGLPSKVDASSQALYSRLAKLHGAAFDQAYRADMIKGHRAVLKALQSEMKYGHDNMVQGYAVKLEPTVKMHLKMAQTKTTM